MEFLAEIWASIYNFVHNNLDTLYKISILIIGIINIIFVLRNWYVKRTEKYYKLYDMFLTLYGYYDNYKYIEDIIKKDKFYTDLNKSQSDLLKLSETIAFHSISINDEIKTVKNKAELKKYLSALFEIKDKNIDTQIEVLNQTCDYIFLKFNKKYKTVFRKFRKNPNFSFGLAVQQAEMFNIFKRT